MCMNRKLVLYFLLIPAITSAVLAESAEITGVVSNRSGMPVSHAVVTLMRQDLVDTTDSNGTFTITGEVSVLRRQELPGNEKISFHHGIVSLSLTAPAPVRIDMFDLRGKVIERILEHPRSAGEYRFSFKNRRLPASVVVIGISVGGHTTSFRYFPSRAAGHSAVSPAPSRSAGVKLAKVRSQVDSLRISAFGYLPGYLPVNSYREAVAIMLDTVPQVFGTFIVSLIPSESITTVGGKMYDGPTPSTTVWEESAREGGCRLFIPRVPFCPEPCGGSAACVEDDSCAPYPASVAVGTISVSGIGTLGGSAAFTMKHINKYYQPADQLAYPPFQEGDPVVFSIPGESAIGPFVLSSRGISPLIVLNDTITLEDGQPMNLLWTPPAIRGNSTIFVLVDISHHGGQKGKIECECEDNGSLTIPAVLIDKLKALGISGFPKIEVTRASSGFEMNAKAALHIESKVTKYLQIPGIISCMDDSECPDGQTCQFDFQCR